MTNLEKVKSAIAGKEKNLRVLMWVKKAGGIERVTEEMAAQIVKICRLQEPQRTKRRTTNVQNRTS